MNNILNQILHFLQQGIAAIFHFVQLIWNWSIDEISKLLAIPWQDWPLLKLVLLILIVAAVVWALLAVAWQLWEAAERILAAFAMLLVVLVHTLPRILLAGIIALGGVWLMNHIDNSLLRLPPDLRIAWSSEPPPPTQPQGRAASETAAPPKQSQ
jgi:hypothetical protein